MATLLLADVAQGSLGTATSRSLTAAKAIGEPVTVLVAGEGVEQAARDAALLEGVASVILADARLYAHQLAEPMAELIVGLAAKFTTIMGSATTSSKNILPRVAARLDVMQVSEIIKVISADTFERPIYAGNAVQTVRSTDTKRVITVRTSAFPPTLATDAAAPIERIEMAADPRKSSFKGEAVANSTGPN